MVSKVQFGAPEQGPTPSRIDGIIDDGQEISLNAGRVNSTSRDEHGNLVTRGMQTTRSVVVGSNSTSSLYENGINDAAAKMNGIAEEMASTSPSDPQYRVLQASYAAAQDEQNTWLDRRTQAQGAIDSDRAAEQAQADKEATEVLAALELRKKKQAIAAWEKKHRMEYPHHIDGDA